MRQSWSDDRLDDLQLEMRNGFARMEAQVEQRAARTEKLIEVQIKAQSEVMERRFGEIEQRDQETDRRLEALDKRMDRLEDRVEFGFGRLDGRIDSQTRASIYMAGLLCTIVVALLTSRLFF